MVEGASQRLSCIYNMYGYRALTVEDVCAAFGSEADVESV